MMVIKVLSWWCPAEAQKPKTFRVETFYAQKLSGRSARKRFSGQALLPLTTLPKMNPLTVGQEAVELICQSERKTQKNATISL